MTLRFLDLAPPELVSLLCGAARTRSHMMVLLFIAGESENQELTRTWWADALAG